MELHNIIRTRYTAKAYNREKKVSDTDLEMIKDLLQYSASSTNMQPWHFIIAKSDTAKEKVLKSVKEYPFNAPKVADSSLTIVFAAKTDIDENYLQHILAQEEKDNRFKNADAKKGQHAGRSMFSNFHKYKFKDWQHWAEKQIHLNVGNLLLGTAIMGLDSTTIEGFDPQIVDEEFGLRQKGFAASLLVTLGYSADDDFNKSLTKSRLPQSETIEVL